MTTSSAEGLPLGTRTTRHAITMGADGATFSGELASVFADPAGAEIATFSATLQATRLHAEGPAMPGAATPTG